MILDLGAGGLGFIPFVYSVPIRPRWPFRCPTSLLQDRFHCTSLPPSLRLFPIATPVWSWTPSQVLRCHSNPVAPNFYLSSVGFVCQIVVNLTSWTSYCLPVYAVISLDTLGEEDTESMIMLEPAEDQGTDDGRSMVITGTQGPTGKESPTAQTPKRSPPSYNTQGGLRKRRKGASSQHKPLPNKPQDLQVGRLLKTLSMVCS